MTSRIDADEWAAAVYRDPRPPVSVDPEPYEYLLPDLHLPDVRCVHCGSSWPAALCGCAKDGTPPAPRVVPAARWGEQEVEPW